MKKFGILILFLVHFYSPINAQLEADNWIFHPSFGINFNGASYPNSFNIPLPSPFGGSFFCYSDKNGKLLFYGAGGDFFDRNFQRFPSTNFLNNTSLYSSPSQSDASQTVIVLPVYNDDSIFYYFHIRTTVGPGIAEPTSLYYSKVNMRLRGGLGEVDPIIRNIPLLNGAEVQYKLTAALHCNKKDIWLIGHLVNSDKYFSILIKQDGTIAPAIYFSGSFIGTTPNTGTGYDFKNWGSCKISALGNKFASAFTSEIKVEIFDFNNVTGLGNNMKTIYPVNPTDTVFSFGNGPFGIEFSPSGQRLYVNTRYDINLNVLPEPQLFSRYLYQFDLTQPNELAILNSYYFIKMVELLEIFKWQIMAKCIFLNLVVAWTKLHILKT
jgi:hypothetical protein